MPDGFWLGVAATIGAFATWLLLRWWWRRHMAWRDFSNVRLIPPPKVGRWQVWRISPTPVALGRFRARWTARIVAWGLAREAANFGHHYQYEARRIGRSQPSKESS